MNSWLAFGAALALAAVAACNAPEQAQAPAVNEAASGAVADGTVDAAGIARIMHDRHERYEEIGKAMKGIGDQLKSSEPSIAAIRAHAGLIARYAPQVPGWFPPGSGPETGRETRAKAEIWSDWETFRQRAQAFETEAARFAQTVEGGDLAAIRAGQRELGAACKNCHDRFRAPEHD